MSTSNPEKLVHRVFNEVLNEGNFDVADELLSPNYVNYGFPGVPPGPEGFKQVMGMFKSAFPDMKIHIEETIVDGEMVSTRGTATGTHTGEFMGIPPTGNSINFSYIDIWRAEDDKLVENWVQMDRMTMMQQLGVIPTPGE